MISRDNPWKYVATGIAVISGILIAFFYLKSKENQRKIKELEKEVEENENLTKEIKLKLKDLIENNRDLDPHISEELGQIATLIESKHDTKAVLALAKIIENLLKELYKNDSGVRQLAASKNRKKPVFDDYLEYARIQGVISKEDYHLLAVMKLIRNEEAHELSVKKEKSKVLSSFLVGFTTVLVLWKHVRNKAAEQMLNKIIEC